MIDQTDLRRMVGKAHPTRLDRSLIDEATLDTAVSLARMMAMQESLDQRLAVETPEEFR